MTPSTPSAGQEATSGSAPPDGKRIVDLTLPITSGMDAFPGEPTAHFTPFSSIDDGGIEMWNVSLFSQLGTHVDAPSHFVRDGSTVDVIDLAKCVGPAVIIDITNDRNVTPDDLRPHEAAIRDTGRVLLRSGWSRLAGSPHYWNAFPEVTPEAADYLVALQVTFLGLDTPTPSTTHLHVVHRALLENGVVIAECVHNLESVRSRMPYLVCLPLPLVGLDGAPARIVAIETEPEPTNTNEETCQ